MACMGRKNGFRRSVNRLPELLRLLSELKETAGVVLHRVPERHFEAAGTVFGLLASLSIASQVYRECTTDQPSTVSVLYASGFLTIFLFWTLYGIRFRHTALWLTNGIAMLIQAALLIVIMLK